MPPNEKTADTSPFAPEGYPPRPGIHHDEFKTHQLSPTGLVVADSVAVVFDEALGKLMALVPHGRYLSIVRTKLEEACFFAKKGVASHPDNQV